MPEVFQSKYTAEEIEQIYDHVNDKNHQIDVNTEEIEKVKAALEASYTKEEVTNAIKEIW